jgi:hypothetical protein
MYTPIKLKNISTDQHEKLKKAIRLNKSLSIKVNVDVGSGKHEFLLTPSQIQRIERARLIGHSTVTIHLSKQQVKANVEYKGGFLASLLGLAARVLPTLLGGLTTGLISGGIEKAISGRGLSAGDGLYLHKSGHSVKITPIRGKGLQLFPKKCKAISGDGLFLKRGSQIYDGRGLLLGKNSPFKNIPILGLLL